MGHERVSAPPRDLPAFRVDVVNSEASALVRQGLAILASANPDRAARALACFDRALDLRRDLPVETTPMLRYDLGGTWLNRAAALVALGGAGALETAMGSCDAAIAALRDLPLDADARFPRRLAIAYQNRALARRRLGPDAAALAKGDLVQALEALGHQACDTLADRPYLMAVIWVNMADLEASEADESSWRRAIESTSRARQLVRDLERQDVAAAEIGLMARHVCCRAAGKSLERRVHTAGAVPDQVHVATDAADEGLELARYWQRRGIHRFADLAEDLFQFGARAYGMFQPHFVSEFLSEQSPGPGFRVLADQ